MLRVTGGCAKVEKSYWWLMKQVYDEKNECWRWGKTEGMEMDVEGDDGTYTSVKSLPLNKEKKFLGVHDSPEGGNVDELEAKRKKVETFVQRMSNGNIPSYLGRLAYRLQIVGKHNVWDRHHDEWH